ncbi:hypothetical protein C8J56DRAFT_994645 [Mycena floridula]|nr:hypothetical protein C8J56DRAFT_994645 [Mycena floridula]
MTTPASASEPLSESESKPTRRRRDSQRKHTSAKSSESTPLEDKPLSPATVEAIAKQQFRQSSYSPEFLKAYAKNEQGSGNVKVVTGEEADHIYQDMLRQDDPDLTNPDKTLASNPNRRVVFAFPCVRAGRKVVDLYMQKYRKKEKIHELKGTLRKGGFLDMEFNKFQRKIDEEHRRSQVEPMKRISSSPLARPRPPLRTSSPKPQSAPEVMQSTEEDLDDLPRPRMPVADLDRNSMASVTSLPLLNMIPGVPMSHRLPLRVTNPDPGSPTYSLSSNRGSAIVRADEGFPSSSVIPMPVVPEVVPAPVETDDPVETAPDKKHRSKKSRHRRHERTSSEDGSPENSPEILIVLMDDEKAPKRSTWHKGDTPKMPIRKPSRRLSPWNGPLAHSDGEIQRYPHSGSGHETDNETDDSDDEDGWNTGPVVPMRAALTALGYLPQPSTYSPAPSYAPSLPRSFASGPAPYPPFGHSYQASPYAPPLSNYTTPYTTPYASPYASPYSTPYTMSSPQLPAQNYPSPYVGAASPYIPSRPMSWANPNAIYSNPPSPYVHAQNPY